MFIRVRAERNGASKVQVAGRGSFEWGEDEDTILSALNAAALSCRERADRAEEVVGEHSRCDRLRADAARYDELRERLESVGAAGAGEPAPALASLHGS
jgi:hypothetical protein